MSAAPTCLNCPILAHPHWKMDRDHHSHCCFHCRKIDGQEHVSYCAYHIYTYSSDRISLSTCESRGTSFADKLQCRPPWENHCAQNKARYSKYRGLSCEKRGPYRSSDSESFSEARESGDAANGRCHAPRNIYSAHEDEPYSKYRKIGKENPGPYPSPDVEFCLLQNYVLTRVQSHDIVDEWVDLFRAYNRWSKTGNQRNLVDDLMVYPVQ